MRVKERERESEGGKERKGERMFVDRLIYACTVCSMTCVYYFVSWFIPFIGHMGICTSAGIIRDFAGPYFVSVS